MYRLLCPEESCALFSLSARASNPSEVCTEPAIHQPIRYCPLVRFLVFITSSSSTASLIPYFRLVEAICSATNLLYIFFSSSTFLLRSEQTVTFCYFHPRNLSRSFQLLCLVLLLQSPIAALQLLILVVFHTLPLEHFSRRFVFRLSPFLSPSPCCRDGFSWPPGLLRAASHRHRCVMRSCH